MIGLARRVRIETERMTLRLPQHADFRAWAALREASRDVPDPVGAALGRRPPVAQGFHQPRLLGERAPTAQGTALPLLLIRREDRRACWGRSRWTTSGAARRRRERSATGSAQPHARQGYMREAILAVVHHAFTVLDLSRIEAACLPENAASRGVLEKCGFKYEGVAQSYLQIAGRWRNHVLYANLRGDRRGRTEVG